MNLHLPVFLVIIISKIQLLLVKTYKSKTQGKCLIIGGGIANFTNVASTFKGIVRALTDYKQPLINNNVKIYVRRGGPNYQVRCLNYNLFYFSDIFRRLRNSIVFKTNCQRVQFSFDSTIQQLNIPCTCVSLCESVDIDYCHVSKSNVFFNAR